MRPDEAVMKALEEEGIKDRVDAEKLAELAMEHEARKRAELMKERPEKC